LNKDLQAATSTLHQAEEPQETCKDEIGRSLTVSLLATDKPMDVKRSRSGLEKGAVTPKAVLEELFSLLEEYGPSWYTEEHRDRAVSALLTPESRSVFNAHRLGITN